MAADSAPPEGQASADASAPPEGPHRAERGELISAAGALSLLVIMFAFAWYGVDGIPGKSEVSTAENAWNSLTVVRWLMLLTIFVTLGSLVIHATQRTHGAKTETSGVITVLGTLTALILTWRVVIHMPSPAAIVDAKLGAYLGVASAYAIALGGYDAMRTLAVTTDRVPHRRRPAASVAQRPEGR